MIWFFERRRAWLHYEIRRQSDGEDYELVINWPDGRQEVERYTDPDALSERSLNLERTLTEDGWEPPRVGTRRTRRSVGSY